MYAFCKHEANLELITNANSLVKISSTMLEWSRRIINMLLYENGEILTQYEHRKKKKFWYTTHPAQSCGWNEVYPI